MKDVIALSSFDHDGMRRRGDVFQVSPQVAAELVRAGLAEIKTDEKPEKPKPKAKK